MILLECEEVEERPVTTGEREMRERRAKDTNMTSTLFSNICDKKKEIINLIKAVIRLGLYLSKVISKQVISEVIWVEPPPSNYES